MCFEGSDDLKGRRDDMNDAVGGPEEEIRKAGT